MFYGQARHTIDQKGRVILPSKYRDKLGESFFVLRGFEKCLFVYAENEFRELEEKIKALPSSNDGGFLQRFIFNYTEQVTPDKQGRVILAQHLRDYAGLNGEANTEVIITGASSRVEIWSVAEYEGYEQKSTDDPDRLAKILEIFNI